MSEEVDWTKAMPRRRGEVWVRRDGDETAVYDPETGHLYRLNPSALALWELCDGETMAQEMAEAIMELSGADSETALEQVTETLRGFVEERLVMVV